MKLKWGEFVDVGFFVVGSYIYVGMMMFELCSMDLM